MTKTMAKRFSRKDPKVGDNVNVFFFIAEEGDDNPFFPAVIVHRCLIDGEKFYITKANDTYDIYKAKDFKVVSDD